MVLSGGGLAQERVIGRGERPGDDAGAQIDRGNASETGDQRTERRVWRGNNRGGSVGNLGGGAREIEQDQWSGSLIEFGA